MPTAAPTYRRNRRISAVLYGVAFAMFAVGAVFALVLPGGVRQILDCPVRAGPV